MGVAGVEPVAAGALDDFDVVFAAVVVGLLHCEAAFMLFVATATVGKVSLPTIM